MLVLGRGRGTARTNDAVNPPQQFRALGRARHQVCQCSDGALTLKLQYEELVPRRH
jgi:hypothetical protein